MQIQNNTSQASPTTVACDCITEMVQNTQLISPVSVHAVRSSYVPSSSVEGGVNERSDLACATEQLQTV